MKKRKSAGKGRDGRRYPDIPDHFEYNPETETYTLKPGYRNMGNGVILDKQGNPVTDVQQTEGRTIKTPRWQQRLIRLRGERE